MTLLDRIRRLVFGEDMPRPVSNYACRREQERHDDTYEHQPKPAVSTPADDPALDEIAASGVQPVSKPWEIEEAQNPSRKSQPVES